MKRSLFLLLTVALFAACTKDVDENLAPDAAHLAAYSKIVGDATPDAIKGAAVVRVSEEVADRIEASETRAGGTRSGIESLDLRLDEIGVNNFHRVFPVDKRFEADHRAAGLHLWYYVTFDRSNDLMAAARTLSLDESIEAVTFDRELKHFGRDNQLIPFSEAAPASETVMPYNDPLLPRQWHYNNDATVPQEALVGADVNAFNAWKIFSADESAREIVVAVLDDPIQTTHPDLQANMWTNPDPEEVALGLVHGANFVVSPETDNNDIHDMSKHIGPLNWELTKVFYNGQDRGYSYLDHGSHTAGTIAAVNNNGIGVAGVAGGKSGQGGNVKLMSCQIFRPIEQSYESQSTMTTTARAFVWAADRGAAISSNSWGYEGTRMTETEFSQMLICTAIDYFIDYNKSDLFGGKGLVIFAAGNSGDINKGVMVWPAAYSRVLAVASIGPNYKPAYYSDYGTWVDISAPGGDPYASSKDTSYDSLGGYGDGCVLSCIIDPKTANTKVQTDRVDAYAWMCGTSMACPHVTGVASLGLAYATKIGKSFSLEEFKSLLLTSTYSLKPYLPSAYGVADMGAGAIDALKFLCNIAGYPVLTVVADGELNQVDLSRIMGGLSTRTLEVEVPQDTKSRLGITSNIALAPAGLWNLQCSNAGAGLITVSTQSDVGGTPVSQTVLLVAKATESSNGGWL